MSKNLIISYDLYAPGKNYEAVSKAIKSLGGWAHVHKSVWYVKSTFSASAAAKKVRAAMDSNDSLIVIDATNNEASWYSLGTDVSDYLKQKWNQARAA